MVFAYDYPLLSAIWTIFVFCIAVLWIFTVIWCFIDNFRRIDHGGWAKFWWTLFIIFLPFIGVLSYILTRPLDPFAVAVAEDV